MEVYIDYVTTLVKENDIVNILFSVIIFFVIFIIIFRYISPKNRKITRNEIKAIKGSWFICFFREDGEIGNIDIVINDSNKEELSGDIHIEHEDGSIFDIEFTGTVFRKEKSLFINLREVEGTIDIQGRFIFKNPHEADHMNGLILISLVNPRFITAPAFLTKSKMDVDSMKYEYQSKFELTEYSLALEHSEN